jgi:signal transduction histidine kinase/ligand-binding sensor domain-containing protein/DNA-binding response OmpR family regulator
MKEIIKKKIVLIVSLIFILPFAYSQNYHFSHLNMKDGLSYHRVKYILRDSKGFMWFGTSRGLNRFDGKNIKSYLSDPDDTTTIASNEVNALYEDPKGRIWVDTYSGLNIFDPRQEKFTRNPNNILREYSLPNEEINKIFDDGKGNWFFLCNGVGIFRYSLKTNGTELFKNIQNDTSSIADNFISDIGADPSGNYWITHFNGVVEKINPETMKVTSRINLTGGRNSKTSIWYHLTVDNDGDLWVIGKANTGLLYINPAKAVVKMLNNKTAGFPLNSNFVAGVQQNNDGKIWIATDHGGLNILDKKDFSIRYLLFNPNNEKGLSENSTTRMYKDKEGIIWMGTPKSGIDYYHEELSKFNLVKRLNYPVNELKFDDTNCFEEDNNGNLWVGSNEGGLSNYNRSTNKFTYFNNTSGRPAILPSNVIVSLFRDRNNILWIGTFASGLYSFNGQSFTHYKRDPANPSSISSDFIWKIYEDTEGNLWIGTNGDGLDLFDRKTNRFIHFKLEMPNSIHNDFITSIIEDKYKNLWVGTTFGIDILEKNTNKFTHYLHDKNDPKTIIGSSITCLLQDSRENIWVGTKEGLSLLNPKRELIKNFTIKDGLPSNYIASILEDEHGSIWMGTINGLSNLSIKKLDGKKIDFEIRNYSERDGLQGNAFNDNSAFKTSKNELVFGGPNGFNIFKPSELKTYKSDRKVMFTELQVFNSEIKPGRQLNGRAILSKSITETKKLVLNNDENVFSITFSNFDYFHPENKQYRYKLEGFDKDWNEINNDQNRISYTNLSPGDYELKVISSNSDGTWNSDAGTINITILPPFYKTNFAYGFYFLLILFLVFLSRKLIILRTFEKFRTEQERLEATRLHQIDLMKIKFFTNISHEFRTPLSLILTPIERMLDEVRSDEQRKKYLMIHRNAKRLMNLVNQLLDFRKIEVHEVHLSPSEGDLIGAVKETCLAFSDISEKKNIQLTFHSDIARLITFFDADKIERIIFNLLSNAFKFTPDGGKISVEIHLLKNSTLLNEVPDSVVKITVRDTGVGIPEDKRDLIFERFFQYDHPENIINQGSGIGLSITKEFVQLHGGRVYVENANPGAAFVVLLPTNIVESSIEFELSQKEQEPANQTYNDNLLKSIDLHKQTVLIVEDNEDFRFYLKDNLKEHFNVLEAEDGKQGWAVVSKELPDLVVSDVMMPKMDGLQLSKKIRNDINTSHIPIILLSARSKEEQKIEGYESGASEYLSKPFNYKILLARIKTLISEREVVKKSFQKNIGISPSEISITSLDQVLITKAIELVEKNMDNDRFSVEEMGRELGISRGHLYKKIYALTGKTPTEFIRLIRIKRAAQLLEKSQLTVSEVSNMVGINNIKYFAKYFKAEFNELPSQYAKKFKLSSGSQK